MIPPIYDVVIRSQREAVPRSGNPTGEFNPIEQVQSLRQAESDESRSSFPAQLNSWRPRLAASLPQPVLQRQYITRTPRY
jgi:hypothetical protein